jgi:hypothetical protein
MEGYATRYSPAEQATQGSTVLAFGRAVVETFGLVVTFGGIGVVVNVILVYIFIQVRGEHEQNEEYRAERQRRFGS